MMACLLFADHGIFYEFMPVEEYGKPKAKTFGLKQVDLNKNYALVISTNGGLWRYLVGDTIQFTSLRPFKIKVTGQTETLYECIRGRSNRGKCR